MFFTAWTHQTYADYSVDLSNLPFYSTDTLNLGCLRYGFYAVYGMDPSNINCLQNEHTKLKLFTLRTHQTYIVYGIDPSNLNCLRMETSNSCCLQYEHMLI
jgi:hypothetical protein